MRRATKGSVAIMKYVEMIECLDLVEKNIRTIANKGEVIPLDLIAVRDCLKDSIIKHLQDKLEGKAA